MRDLYGMRHRTHATMPMKFARWIFTVGTKTPNRYHSLVVVISSGVVSLGVVIS